jgi:hypothetical protein
MTDDNDYIEVTTRIRRTRSLTVAYNKAPGSEAKIAAIRFSGAYLEDMGFTIGGAYKLRVNEDNTITLTPTPDENKEQDPGSDMFDSEVKGLTSPPAAPPAPPAPPVPSVQDAATGPDSSDE